MTTPTLYLEQGVSAQPKSFFDRLHYDVRHIVYEHFDDLPPTTSGKSFSGFILSCQLAKVEVEQFAAKKAAKQLQDFKIKYKAWSGFSIGIPPSPGTSTFAQLRNITITLPIEVLFLDHEPIEVLFLDHEYARGWKAGTLQGLHHLWAKHFDMVHVKFVGDLTVAHKISTDDVPDFMYGALQDIGEILYYADKKGLEDAPGTESPSTDTFITDDAGSALIAPSTAAWNENDRRIYEKWGDVTIYKYLCHPSSPLSSAPIRTKRICLSWTLDSRISMASPTLLTGKAYLPKLDYRDTVSEEDRPLYYHISNAEGTSAEMGIVSATRWRGLHALLSDREFLRHDFDGVPRYYGEEWELETDTVEISVYSSQRLTMFGSKWR